MDERWVENKSMVGNGWKMHETWVENKSMVGNGWKMHETWVKINPWWKMGGRCMKNGWKINPWWKMGGRCMKHGWKIDGWNVPTLQKLCRVWSLKDTSTCFPQRFLWILFSFNDLFMNNTHALFKHNYVHTQWTTFL